MRANAGIRRPLRHWALRAADAGHLLEFHNGDIRGRGADELRRLVERSGLVIILTTINSHGGVQLAKRIARKRNRPAVEMQKCGQCTFRELLAIVNGHGERSGAMADTATKRKKGIELSYRSAREI